MDDHEHGHNCGHEHGHEHGHNCGCGHEHEHGHNCGCGHEHSHCCEHGEVAEHELAQKASFSYKVLGLDCPNCALRSQTAVQQLSSVKDARLVYATATLEVVAEEGRELIDVKRDVLEAIRSQGHDLQLTQEEIEQLSAERSWFSANRERILMLISGIALVAGLIIEHLLGSEERAIPYYVVAAVAGLVFVAPMALAALKRKTADMNVLMGIAVLGALIMGYGGDRSVFADAAIVIFLDQLGDWLEGWSMRKTSASIEELIKLAPDTAHVVHADHVHEMAVSEVKEGQHIRILAGERVPLDGIIVQGASSFNEAAITGESMPQDKGTGDTVYAGSLNTSSVCEIEVTADEDCTKLARIIALVQGAQAQKAPYESFINRFAEVYTPIVVAIAAVIGLLVPLVLSIAFGPSASLWHDWIYRALSLLVVACPCALVISTPVAFVSAITRAANTGVLVKGGAFFDIASKVDTMLFDKTGTLTSGNPEVVALWCAAGAKESDVLSIAYALESASTHPLARAICSFASERNVHCVSAQDVEEIAAGGIKGSIAGLPCSVGKPSFVSSCAKLDNDVLSAIKTLSSQGSSALVVCGDGRVAGVIGVADSLRANARSTCDELRALGIEQLEMLTGDNEQTAKAIAKEANITEVRAELLPEDKAARVHELTHNKHVCAFIGDGINDAPALAHAHLGITLGAAASDTALEVADVALLSDDISALPGFFALAKRTMHIVQENISFAILVKALVFVLVIAGVAGMGAAVFADTGVALIVILNSLRLMLEWNTRW